MHFKSNLQYIDFVFVFFLVSMRREIVIDLSNGPYNFFFFFGLVAMHFLLPFKRFYLLFCHCVNFVFGKALLHTRYICQYICICVKKNSFFIPIQMCVLIVERVRSCFFFVLFFFNVNYVVFIQFIVMWIWICFLRFSFKFGLSLRYLCCKNGRLNLLILILFCPN